MATELKRYLNRPDMLFRRVRDEHGELQLSKKAKAYHPGMGMYRSSYKNALRLTATETNIAYRTADYERYKDLDFVVGIEIHLSGNHTLNGVPFTDICDQLKGKYPKNFKFVGWHPNCRCYVTSILKTEAEMERDNARILAGEEPLPDSENEVKDVPDGFSDWVEKNGEKVQVRKSKPYFFEANKKYVEEALQNNNSQHQETNTSSKKGIKLGRSQTKEAFEIYENSKPVTLSKEQQENINEIAKEIGVDVKPMTFLEANEGRSNIVRDVNNCQMCVAVHEARLRGLNVTAKAYSGVKGSIELELGEHFENIWINPKILKTPQITKLSGKDTLSKLEKSTKAIGRYHIGINRKNGDGHIITSERISENEMLFYDPQRGEFQSIQEYISDKRFEYIEVLKVDKLLFNRDIFIKISKII